MTKLLSKDDELILLCAFRYAFGRQTYMPDVVVRRLLRDWDHLSQDLKKSIKKEINEEWYQLTDIDKPTWQQILDKD